MKMLTKALEARFAAVGRQEKVKDPIVIAKFFDCCSNWTWFATEYDPEERLFFGLVVGFENEFGYFSLDELEQTKNRLGLPLERDLHFRELPLSVIKANLGMRE